MLGYVNSFFILVTINFLIVSCGSQEDSQSQRKKNQTLFINLFSEPPTLDPRETGDATSSDVLRHLFDGLTRIGPDGDIDLAVAEKFEMSSDGLIYTFYLKSTRWNDGSPVTALDFSESWKTVLDPSFPAQMAYQLYVIKNADKVKSGELPVEDLGVEILNSHTLRVSLESPTPYFLELLSTSPFLPVHHHIAKRNPDWARDAKPDFVSNGPFYLNKWKHQNELVLKKNPHYWDKDSVTLKKIVMSMIEDSNTELQLFQSGELDWAGKPISIGLPTEAIPSLHAEGILQIQKTASTYFYIFNTTQFPLNNRKLRKALSYALNRQSIVDNISQAGEMIALSLVPPSMSLREKGYLKDQQSKEAQKLFAEALKELKLTEETFPALHLSYNTSDGHQKIAQAVQEQWREVLGIDISLDNFEWKVYLDKLQKRDFQIGRLGWVADFNDPVTFLEMYEEGDNPINHTGWENVRYAALLQRASQTVNIERRKNLLHEAEKILMDEMPIAPLYFHTNAYLKHEQLKGVVFSPIGHVDFKWAYWDNNHG
ncbi:MAG: ABC transporter substrate-binding protein [Waddliaceae bacterium]|nr:ABC transporter substrate-binding protein [Waddliaceae bacterium]